MIGRRAGKTFAASLARAFYAMREWERFRTAAVLRRGIDACVRVGAGSPFAVIADARRLVRHCGSYEAIEALDAIARTL